MDNVLFHFFVFIYCLYGGILIGILLDIHKALTMKKAKRKTYLIDMIFLLIGVYIFIKILYTCTYGQWRFYIILWVLTGLLVYRKIFSKTVVTLLYKLRIKVNSYMPIKIVENMLYNPIYVLHLKLKYAIIKVQKLIRVLLTNTIGKNNHIEEEVIKCPKEKKTEISRLKRCLSRKRKKEKKARHH